MRVIPADRLLERRSSLPAVQSSLWLAQPMRPIMDGWVITADGLLSPGNFDAVPAIIGPN
ncbi:hypothetical protein [Niveispirillum sp. KHB5.9]|uniref:hypothetical protein n=1 Tax=Niveispirillum sp. KHB5.9 TaxID=3400269 RepID=UPI003A882893